MQTLDNRIVKAIVTVDGISRTYDGEYVSAKGITWNSPMNGNANVTILNMEESFRQKVLKASLPLADIAKKPTVEVLAGRESNGANSIFYGEVFMGQQTYKPNLGVELKCLTGYSLKYVDVERTIDTSNLQSIAGMIAADCRLKLVFEATDKNIKGFSYKGSADGELKYFQSICNNLNIYSDSKSLFVLDKGKTSKTLKPVNVDASTGLIRITPIVNGVQIDTLFNPDIKLSSLLNVTSVTNNSLSGRYTVIQSSFDLSSRSSEFFQTVLAQSSN